MKKKRVLIIVFTFLFAILCIGLSTGGLFYKYLSGFNKVWGNNGDKVEPIINKDKEEPINILVMGVDIGTPGADEANNHRRTDTIIVVNYSPKNDNVNMISIPRDTLIRINGKNQKINAANAIGGEKYLIESVQQLLDIDINYYGKVDYAGFREFIDAIGGVDMKISTKMDYDDPGQNLHIHFNKGETVHLDGKKAEEFFRWRKNNDGTGLATGDLGRIENQHLFIEKVIEKFKSPTIITKIPSILKVIPSYVETNMPPGDILKYGTNIAKINRENISMTTLQGDLEYIDGVSYLIYDKKKNKDVLAQLHTETAAVFQGGAMEKDKLKIQVLNGTKRSGLAATFSQALKEGGYSSIALGNNNKATKSSVTVYGIDEKYKDVIKKDFNIDNITFEKVKSTGYDIVVVLGEDYRDK